MKKIIILALAVIAAALFAGTIQKDTTDVIRIHIRANSNETEDQDVKYVVKDSVVEYLTPLLADAESKDEMIEILGKNLRGIENVANGVLLQNGYTYSAVAEIRKENFPTRSYGDEYVFEEGIYDALIIELGSGTGNNWWCVLYPPLCFVPVSGDGENFVYRSKILELIENFKK